VDGIIFAKIGTELPPDATVAVSIAPEASSWDSIVTETGPPSGYLSVTYESCPPLGIQLASGGSEDSPSETKLQDAYP